MLFRSKILEKAQFTGVNEHFETIFNADMAEKTTRAKVSKRNVEGFTLLELIIVVAVIGILASIVTPSYQQHIQKTRRVAAQADLVELAAFMERQYTQNFSYLNADGNAPALPFDEMPRDGGNIYYTVDFFGDVSATTYTLMASTRGSQSNDSCHDLLLDHDGKRYAQHGDTEIGNCW